MAHASSSQSDKVHHPDNATLFKWHCAKKGIEQKVIAVFFKGMEDFCAEVVMRDVTARDRSGSVLHLLSEINVGRVLC